jgi:hypothetical protein
MGLRPLDFAMSPHAIAKITATTKRIPGLKLDDELVLVWASAATGVATTVTPTVTPTTTAAALILRTIDMSPSLLR